MAERPKDEEGILQQLCDSMERVMEAAKRVCKRKTVGLSTVFEINRRSHDKKASRPFHMIAGWRATRGSGMRACG